MHDELTSPEVPLTSRRGRAGLTRFVGRRRLRRRDRMSAGLAAAHGAIAVVDDAALLIELGWAAGTACTGCDRNARHGGATGSRLCVVGALNIAADGTPALLHRATDLVWQQLYRGRPRRTVHWNSPATRHALQVQDLRAWNDGPGATAPQAAALVRATLRAARSDLARVRDEADALVTSRV